MSILRREKQKHRIILEALAFDLREATLVGMGAKVRETCIASTRIAMHVLDLFGIRSEPVPCAYAACNGAACRLIDREAELPKSEADAARWTDAGAYIVQIDERSGSKYNGHLILQTAYYLADLSLDAASRPEKDLPLSNWVLPVRHLPFTLQTSGGRVFYWMQNRPEVDWERSHDWQLPTTSEPLVVELAEQCRQRLPCRGLAGLQRGQCGTGGTQDDGRP